MLSSNRRTRKRDRTKWWNAINTNIQNYSIAHGLDTGIRWKKFPKYSMNGGGGDPTLHMWGISEENYPNSNNNSISNNNGHYTGSEYDPVVYTIDKMITVKGKRYKYRETENGMNIVLRKTDAEVCFHIRILPEDTVTKKKIAILQTFHQYSSCSVDDKATGRDLLLAVVTILQERKDIIRMELQDESHKDLPNGKSIPLADMYFVCTGNTWYGSIIPLEPQNKTLYIESLKKIQKLSWKKIITCLQRKVGLITIPADISNINTSVPGSAMQVFQRIKETKSDFFADYMNYIISCIGYSSMRGTGWAYYF
jgi:hypothetical protein